MPNYFLPLSGHKKNHMLVGTALPYHYWDLHHAQTIQWHWPYKLVHFTNHTPCPTIKWHTRPYMWVHHTQPLMGLHHAQQLNGTWHTLPYMWVHHTQRLLGLHHAENN